MPVQGIFTTSAPLLIRVLVFAPAGLLIALVAAACASPAPLSSDFSADIVVGPAPLTVKFSPTEESEDAEFAWEFGDGAVNNVRTPSHTYFDVGQFTVRLSVTSEDRSSTGESIVSVQPGPAGWITIEPAIADLENGETRAFKATAYDEHGNPVPDAEITWKVAPAVGAIDENGVLAASGPEGEYEAAVEAEFERLGKSGAGNASVKLAVGPLASVEVVNDGFEISVGRSVQLEAVAEDVYGNVIDDANFEWQAVRREDRITGEGVFTAGTAVSNGTRELVRLVASHEGVELNTEVTGAISSGIIDRVDVTPPEVTVKLEGTVKLEAKAFDRFGNAVTPDSIEWILDDEELGNIDRSGTFTAGTVAGKIEDDRLTVQVTKDGVISYAKVSFVIEPGPAVVLRLGPDGDSVPSGASLPLQIYVEDSQGNQIEDAPIEWTVSGAGRVTDRGVFIAGFETGEFPDAVRAVIAANATESAAELEATISLIVRQRSSDLLAFEVQDQDGGAIYLLDLEEATLLPLSEELVENGSRESGPAWTPDGSLLLYSSDLTGADQIYAIDPSTGAVARLTDDPDGASMPAVSPTGTEFAYVARIGNNWQVYTADFPQSPLSEIEPIQRDAARRVSNDDSLRYVLPHWSPDGRSLVMSSIHEDGSATVVTVDRDGTNEQRVAGGDTDELAFGWLNDGSGLLLGIESDDSGLALITADLPGDHRHTAVDLPFTVAEAYWSPDQSEVVLIDSGEGALWISDTDGTGLRQVIRGEASPGGSAWRPVPIEPST